MNTNYAIQLLVDGEVINTVPTDLENGEKARAHGNDLLRAYGHEVVYGVTFSKFLRNGEPYSNLVGGFADAVVERQLKEIKGELTREPRPTSAFVMSRAGRGRGTTLGLLSILESREEVIRTEEIGTYSWALPISTPMTETNAARARADAAMNTPNPNDATTGQLDDPDPLVEMTLDARERSADRLMRVVETMRSELDRIEATAKLARDGEAIRRDDLIVNHQYASELLRYGAETLSAWEAAGLVERFNSEEGR